MEDEDDKLGHWVVFVGKRHLEGLKDTGLSSERQWNGIILNSDRGYE